MARLLRLSGAHKCTTSAKKVAVPLELHSFVFWVIEMQYAACAFPSDKPPGASGNEKGRQRAKRSAPLLAKSQ